MKRRTGILPVSIIFGFCGGSPETGKMPILRQPRRFVRVIRAIGVADAPEGDWPQRLAVLHEPRTAVGHGVIGTAGSGVRSAAVVAALLEDARPVIANAAALLGGRRLPDVHIEIAMLKLLFTQD